MANVQIHRHIINFQIYQQCGKNVNLRNPSWITKISFQNSPTHIIIITYAKKFNCLLLWI